LLLLKESWPLLIQQVPGNAVIGAMLRVLHTCMVAAAESLSHWQPWQSQHHHCKHAILTSCSIAFCHINLVLLPAAGRSRALSSWYVMPSLWHRNRLGCEML
jgi:hypothetical protein